MKQYDVIAGHRQVRHDNSPPTTGDNPMNLMDFIAACEGHGLVITDDDLLSCRLEELGINHDQLVKRDTSIR
jgi:hypothetical protein